MPLVTGLRWRQGYGNSNPPPFEEQIETNSQNTVVGELVTGVVGFVSKRVAAAELVLGIADIPGWNNANSQTLGLKARYQPVILNAVYMVSISNAGNVANIAQANLFVAYGLIESLVEVDKWVVNNADVATPKVKIIGFVDPVGTPHGRVLVQFLAIAIQSIVV